jgi:subtilisin-like proprotein convertase family protein
VVTAAGSTPTFWSDGGPGRPEEECMDRRPSNATWRLVVVAATAGLALALAGGSRAAAAEGQGDALRAGGGGQSVFHSFSNPGVILINDSAPATPYPSNIAVSGQVGSVADVLIVINDLTHTHPDDIDMMLVSPAGTRVMLQSDAAGGTNASAQDYGFGSSQVMDGAHVPDGDPLTFRYYLPADYEGLEQMPAPAPAGVYYVSTFAFAGENPNGTWSLYVRDDKGSDVGTIAGGWQMLLHLHDNGLATTVPGTGTIGQAVPYPTEVHVPASARQGRISKLRVVLSNVTHTNPDDIDVLLRGPDGQSVLLWSDAGGSTDVAGATFTFEDGAPSMPDAGPLVTGTYRPTNHGAGDTFPAPAPAGPYRGTLSHWNNMRPNGFWSLFAVDDANNEVGGFANWGLEITTVEQGDFDRDAYVDLLWRHDLSGQNVLWYMEDNVLFTGEFTSPPVLADVRWKMVGTHDFNGDQRTDILWRHNASGENVMWFMEKNTLVSGTFTNPPALADVNWQMAGTGDFNGDARPDILWRHDVSGENVVWFMNGHTLTSGTFTTPPSLPDTNWKMVGTGYFDPGLQLDILWWHQASGQLVVWFMDGVTLAGGELTTPPGISSTQWRPVATGDYNRDGRVDIVWRHLVTGDNMIWYMGGPNGTTQLNLAQTDPPTFADFFWKIVGPR